MGVQGTQARLPETCDAPGATTGRAVLSNHRDNVRGVDAYTGR
jgi:hypothetical protein